MEKRVVCSECSRPGMAACAVTGSCSRCKSMTSYSAFKYCDSCSVALCCCHLCGKKVEIEPCVPPKEHVLPPARKCATCQLSTSGILCERGNCCICRTPTPYSAFKYCETCAAQSNRCYQCGISLSDTQTIRARLDESFIQNIIKMHDLQTYMIQIYPDEKSNYAEHFYQERQAYIESYRKLIKYIGISNSEFGEN
jgi:hypothetical protein